MPEKSRQRDVLKGIIGSFESYNNGNLTSVTKPVANLAGRELLYSRGNPWPPSRKQKRGNPNADWGRGFTKFTRTIINDAASVNASYFYGNPQNPSGWRYQGLLLANALVGPGAGLPTPPLGSTISAMGAVGWARYKPTKPRGGLGQFLGELRQLPTLPKLLYLKGQAQTFRQLYKDGASDYLNIQFGWNPFVKELIGFIMTQKKVDKILRQLMRDNGGWVRRRGPVARNKSSSTSSSVGYFTVPSLNSYLHDGTQQRTIETTELTDWWFSGQFKYHIPKGSLPEDNEARSDQLSRIVYGVGLNPQLVWQLMPWSWMADWCTSAGACISNLMDHQDGLVARYAYIMMRKSITTKYTVRGILESYGPFETSQTYLDEIKLRARANPFGFGILDTDMSAYQMSIVAALGLSRGL